MRILVRERGRVEGVGLVNVVNFLRWDISAEKTEVRLEAVVTDGVPVGEGVGSADWDWD